MKTEISDSERYLVADCLCDRIRKLEGTLKRTNDWGKKDVIQGDINIARSLLARMNVKFDENGIKEQR